MLSVWRGSSSVTGADRPAFSVTRSTGYIFVHRTLLEYFAAMQVDRVQAHTTAAAASKA
jgi:hypothetical protein